MEDATEEPAGPQPPLLTGVTLAWTTLYAIDGNPRWKQSTYGSDGPEGPVGCFAHHAVLQAGYAVDATFPSMVPNAQLPRHLRDPAHEEEESLSGVGAVAVRLLFPDEARRPTCDCCGQQVLSSHGMFASYATLGTLVALTDKYLGPCPATVGRTA